MDRYFEKISFKQFKKALKDAKKLYEEYNLPVRKTENSAGYDFLAIDDIIIEPGEIKKIPTGYKAKMLSDEVLLIVMRSSLGFKYNVRLTNQLGIIDSDYYNNEGNEGHIFVSLQNEGKERVYIHKNDAYVQGIFIKYLTCGDTINEKRKSGIGSTNRKEEK